MQQKIDIYEYISLYVNKLSITDRNLKSLVYAHENRNKLNLKGTGPNEFHLERFSYKIEMVFYYSSHTNISTRWPIHIWICLFQRQN